MGIQVKYRPKVWIIDKGDSYESLCLVQGGNYVRNHSTVPRTGLRSHGLPDLHQPLLDR